MSRMTLRPHHALCAQFFVGKGYSAQFVEHMKRVLSELDRGADVTLTDGCDAICAGCPNNRDARTGCPNRPAGLNSSTMINTANTSAS